MITVEETETGISATKETGILDHDSLRFVFGKDDGKIFVEASTTEIGKKRNRFHYVSIDLSPDDVADIRRWTKLVRERIA